MFSKAASCASEREVLYKALEKSLINKSSNLLSLYNLFYPLDYIQTSTVSVIIEPCNFTVGVITSEHSENESRPAFGNCGSYCKGGDINRDDRDFPRHCLNLQRIQLFLSNSAGSNSHSRLVNFISSRYFSVYIMMNEYVSFILFNILTNSQIKQPQVFLKDSIASIDLSIDKLDTMPPLDDVIGGVQLLFAWVSESKN